MLLYNLQPASSDWCSGIELRNYLNETRRDAIALRKTISRVTSLVAARTARRDTQLQCTSYNSNKYFDAAFRSIHNCLFHCSERGLVRVGRLVGLFASMWIGTEAPHSKLQQPCSRERTDVCWRSRGQCGFVAFLYIISTTFRYC